MIFSHRIIRMMLGQFSDPRKRIRLGALLSLATGLSWAEMQRYLPRMVVSFDVGQVNMAVCHLIESTRRSTKAKRYRDFDILHWEVIDIRGPVKSKDVQEIVAPIPAIVRSRPWLRWATNIAIERQVGFNAKMRGISASLGTVFRCLALERDEDLLVEFVQSTKKLEVYTDIEALTDSGYNRKKTAKLHCAAILDEIPGHDKWKELFHGSKKADDLADSYLQGIHWLMKQRSMERVEGSGKIRARAKVKRASRPKRSARKRAAPKKRVARKRSFKK